MRKEFHNPDDTHGHTGHTLNAHKTHTCTKHILSPHNMETTHTAGVKYMTCINVQYVSNTSHTLQITHVTRISACIYRTRSHTQHRGMGLNHQKGMKSHSLQEPGETFREYYAT